MLKWLGIVAILILSLILATPQLLSSRLGNRWILAIANQKISGTLEARSIRLRWFGAQQVDGLVLKGSDGESILSAERVSTEAPIWTLIFGGRNFGKNELIKPILNLTITDQGNNLTNALATHIVPQVALAGPPAWTKKWNLPTGELIIEEGELTIRSPSHATQTFSHIHLKASLNEKLLISITGPFQAKMENNTLNIQNMPTLLIDTAISFAKPELFGLAEEWIGDSISVVFNAQTFDVNSPKLNVTGTPQDFVAKGKDFVAQMRAKDGKGMIAGKGTNWELPSTPFAYNQNLTLENATFTAGNFEGEVAKFDIPLSLDFKPKDVTLIGTLKSKRTTYQEMIFEDVQIGITEGTLAKAKWALFAELQFPDKQFLSGAPVRIDGSFGLDANWDLADLKGSFYMPARYLTVQFVASYAQDEIKLLSPLRIEYFVQQEELLQKPFQITLVVQPTQTKLDLSKLILKGTATFSDVEFKGEAESTLTDLKGAVEINFPKNFATMHFAGKTSTGKEPGKIKGSATLEHFYSQKTLSFDHATLQGEVHFSPLPTAALSLLWNKPNFTDLLGPTIQLDSTFHFSALAPAKGDIIANLFSKYASGKATLNVAEKMDMAFIFKDLSSDGTIDLTGEYADKIFHIQGTANKLTMPWTATFLGLGKEHTGLLEALFGKTVDITGSLSSAGPLTLALDSSNAKVSFQGHLKENILTLTAPLAAQINVTPELGSELLEVANPIFASAIRSEKPVTLTVQPEGFRIPLFPVEMTSLQVGKATLDLGKVWMRNKGFVKSLLNFTKLSTKGEVLTWSTPLYFSVTNGIATYNRMDTLIGEQLHIASWGTINLPIKRVDMTLGIPSDIPGAYLTIPLKGALPDVKVDWKKAGLRLTTALASPEAALLTGALTTKVPPPTTQPYPWGGEEPAPVKTPSIPKIKPKEALKTLKKVFK